MIVTPIKTNPVSPGDSLFAILDTYISKLKEGSIVVITSKIVSLSENRVVKNDGTVDKHALTEKEADWILEDDPERNYGITLTITNDILAPSAGVDESNGNGYFVLWPENSKKTAQDIWEYLKKKHTIKNLGVIISDSRVTPMRWGTIGLGLAWCGFEPLHDYRGTPDIYGMTLRVTKQSIIDGLACAAVLTMGEGNEQTPLAVITDVPFVKFQNRPPTEEEITSLRISKEEDVFAPLLDSPKWRKVR